MLKCHAEPAKVVKAGLYRSNHIFEPRLPQARQDGYKSRTPIVQLPTFGPNILARNLFYIREILEPIIGDDSGTSSHRPLSPRNDGGSVAAAVLQLNRRNSTSTLSLPLSNVPERKSSTTVLTRKVSASSKD